MAKSLALLLVVFISMAAAGLYGILHDQLTYTISPEYYTKFKFIQFGLADEGGAILGNPRWLASLVGFLATVGVGFWIGLVLGVISLMCPDWRSMVRVALRGMLLVIPIALAFGLFGLAYGAFVLFPKGPGALHGWFIPENLIDRKHYIMVGTMHLFSFLGGLLGLLAAAYYCYRKTRNEPKLA